MKVLWVTNTEPPAAARLRGAEVNPFGGWLQGALGHLASLEGLNLTVASPGGGRVRTLGSEAGTSFVTLPMIGRRDAGRGGLEIATRVMDMVSPDIVHVHGTELSHSLSFAMAARNRSTPTAVSIQGLISIYALHMTTSLPAHVVHGWGARPWVRSDRIIGMKRGFEQQGRLEHETLQLVSHVVGRTTWDRICTELINPARHYHHADETLRNSFYTATREPERIRPHSILVGQGHYPIKGMHLLLAALPAVVARFPDTMVMVAGRSPLSGPRTPYGRYLARLVDDLDLASHVRFTGPQTETEMLDLYRSAEVVACPSLIENSPNSVAEAMLLGVPVVSAHVGGVPDMVTPGYDGLTYQADAPYMLAHHINTLFGDRGLAVELASRARERALKRHDPALNAARTLEIYRTILDGGTAT